MTTVIYGKKIEMGEAYIGETRRGVTKIVLSPMTISQLKTVEKDGYSAAQVGFGKPKKHTRRTVNKNREIAFAEGMEKGAVISPKDVVSIGSICNIQGTSKGKGFAGVMKRWNFAGGPRTHGQSDRARAPGSIGQGTTPGRVHKGKKMAGRMGSDTVTVKKSTVVSFDEASNTIWVTGPVPGARHSLVRLTVMDQKDLGVLSYISGGLPVKIIEPVAEVASEGVVSEETQVDSEKTEGVTE
ncbi:MAG: 50S ribosomal protein L3 [bacterium]